MLYRTYSEYLQLPEFRSVCRQVSERSNGVCEIEGCSNKAVDMHHIKYCKWGDVDTADNLLHLCRNCHEQAHTCDGCGGWLKADAIKLNTKLCKECRKAVLV